MQNVPQQVIGFIEIENVHPTGLEADEGFLLLAPKPGQVESKGDLSNDQSADNGQPLPADLQQLQDDLQVEFQQLQQWLSQARTASYTLNC